MIRGSLAKGFAQLQRSCGVAKGEEPRPAFYIVRYDGAHRVSHEEAPIDALERGPVWIVDTVYGHLDTKAPHASLARAGGDHVLVLYNDDQLLGTIPTRRITSYETVTVLDPDFTTPYGIRLWNGLELGCQLTLVHADTGDRH